MPDRLSALTTACEAILIDGLPAALKETIRDAVRRGYSKREIMTVIRRIVRRVARLGTGPLTIAACGAWCDRMLSEYA